MTVHPAPDDMSWTSAGIARAEAVRQWQDWAAQTIAPIDVCVFDEGSFAARWSSHGVGQLRLLRLEAPAQRVVHNGDGAGKASPSIQLVYARHGALKTRMGGKRFTVQPGEFVLLDNTRFYQMEMDTAHEAVDLMMPLGWLDRYLPDPGALLGRPVSAKDGWGAPLGSLLEALVEGLGAEGVDATPLPRPMIAEQIGTLLTLATGFHEPAAESRHRGQLARQILRRIETDFADPDLSPEGLAAELGISKRYLQQLLAGSGTSFVQELTATRLDRASDMLSDPRAGRLTVGEIAFRCGVLDPGYFARAFRKRFGRTPSEWRLGTIRRD
jgi:AraC-like DNA-binding protein